MVRARLKAPNILTSEPGPTLGPILLAYYHPFLEIHPNWAKQTINFGSQIQNPLISEIKTQVLAKYMQINTMYQPKKTKRKEKKGKEKAESLEDVRKIHDYYTFHAATRQLVIAKQPFWHQREI